jgi:histidinol-phosphatase (PHP family)
VDDLGAYCEFVRTTPLRLGLESDYVRGAEDRIETMLNAHDFDYVVGSVHFLGEKGAVDDQRYDVWESFSDADSLWHTYFEWQAELVRSGLFDIVSHPDLIKIWGKDRPAPERDPRFHYEPFVEALAGSGTAVEVSTAGLRKPVGEIYPARALAEMCREAGAEFALSSDAHTPDQVGFGYDEAMKFLEDLGVGRLCVFEGRNRTLEPIGRTGVEAPS